MITMTVRVRRQTTDTFGERTGPIYHRIAGCIRWPLNSSESSDRSATVITGWQLVVPVGSDLDAADDIQFPDDAPSTWWTVEGEALPYESPLTGWAPGTVAALRKATG